MYRIILASTDENISKLADKIWNFIEGQCNYARQHSFLLHELSTKSFRRTISGKACVFKLSKGVLVATCEGNKVGSIDLNQGAKASDANKLAQKVIKQAEA